MYINFLPFETTFHAIITAPTIICYYQSSLQKFQYRYGENVGVIGECTLYPQLLMMNIIFNIMINSPFNKHKLEYIVVSYALNSYKIFPKGNLIY